jgi:signal transduction histidine kinase
MYYIEYEGLEGVFDEEQAEFLNVIYSDDPLVLYLKEKQQIVMKEEIENKDVVSQLEGLKATISIPLFTSRELVGILNLGEKKTKESYYEEDIRILKEFKRFLELHLSHTVFLENSLFYSSGVTHDLRKPFKNGYIYDLVEELSEAEGEERQEIKEELIEKLSRFHNMLNTMLNISDVMKRVINGSFKPKRIKYIELINDIIKSHEKELKDKGLELILDLPRSCDVYAEEDSIRRVVDELITNAIKHTDKGSITIKVSRDKKEVITEVIDTGCGIEEGKQADIWGLFKRVVDSNTKEGYGIGLAVARNLSEINNGRLFLKYSTPNKGSCFCFVLPKK